MTDEERWQEVVAWKEAHPDWKSGWRYGRDAQPVERDEPVPDDHLYCGELDVMDRTLEDSEYCDRDPFDRFDEDRSERRTRQEGA